MAEVLYRQGRVFRLPSSVFRLSLESSSSSSTFELSKLGVLLRVAPGTRCCLSFCIVSWRVKELDCLSLYILKRSVTAQEVTLLIYSPRSYGFVVDRA